MRHRVPEIALSRSLRNGRTGGEDPCSAPRLQTTAIVSVTPFPRVCADFLPFKCDACENTFCLEHRSYDAHKCAKAAGHDRKVIACPVCLQRVPLVTGEDVNVTFERHMASSGCNPERRSAQGRRKPKATCPAQGCRATMGPSNTFKCPSCGRDVCLSHRQPEAHNCGAAPAAAAAPSAPSLLSRGGSLAKGMQSLFSSPSAAPAARARAAAPATPRSSARAAAALAAESRAADRAAEAKRSATRRKVLTTRPAGARADVSATRAPAPAPARMAPGEMSARLREAAAERHAARQGPAATPSRPPREVCEQCGARFARVEQLVAHAIERHGVAGSSTATATTSVARPAEGMGGGSTEVCPRCGQRFREISALIAHCEPGGGCSGQRPAAGSRVRAAPKVGTAGQNDCSVM